MVLSCEHVWREISNYLEGEVDPALRAAIEEHVRGCRHCKAVLDGSRNVIALYGDDRLLEMPLGFSQRLQQKLEAVRAPRRGGSLGWLVAVAAAALLAGTFAIGRSSASQPHLRSEHAQPGKGVPASMMVLVAPQGKTFHVAGCPFIHGKAGIREISSAEALREGYVPCVRCMRKYLNTTAIVLPVVDSDRASAVIP